MSEGFAAPPPPPPPGPPARVRPATVTAATWLLIGYAVLAIAGGAIGLANAGTISDVYRDAYAGTDLEGTEGVASASVIGGAAFSIVIAIGVIVLAMFNHQGKNAARIVTWVLGGIGLCCTGGGLALSGATGGMQVDSGSGPDPAEVQRMVEEALPSWYSGVSLTITILSILAIATALLLLALPPSNTFFRKPEQPFEPPPPGYPPPPSYPQVG